MKIFRGFSMTFGSDTEAGSAGRGNAFLPRRINFPREGHRREIVSCKVPIGQTEHQARGLKKNPRTRPAEREITQRTQKTLPTLWIEPLTRARFPMTQTIVEPHRSLRNPVERMNVGRAFLLVFFCMMNPRAFPLGQTPEQNDRGLTSVITTAVTMRAARTRPTSGINMPPIATKKATTLAAIWAV